MYRGLNDFKMCYQPRYILVKDGNGDLFADPEKILNRQKNYFSQLLVLHSVSDVRQIEIQRAELREPGTSLLEDEIAVAKQRKYKSPGSDQIPAELIKEGDEILVSAIKKPINSSGTRRNCPVSVRNI
jgi:hypothetical protein